MRRFLIKLVTTCLFVGYLPLIPGTAGSVVGLFIFVLLIKSLYLLIPANCLIMILGFLLTGRAATELFKHRDPPQIVIDEVNGMIMAFFALPAWGADVFRDRFILITGFIIFRIFDTIKPYPASWFQRKNGSLGIMGDDIIAGIYTNFVLRVVLMFLL